MKKYAPVIMLLLGLILLAQPIIYPQATVNYVFADTITLGGPTGCTSTAPCNFAMGAAVNPAVLIVSGSQGCCTVTVTPSNNAYYGGPSTLALSSTGNCVSGGCYKETYESSWTVPNNPTSTPQTLTISYSDSIDTINGAAQNGSVGPIYYTISTTITGYCEIDGTKVTSTSSITVTNPTLNFLCDAVTGANLVSSSQVQISQGSSTLSTVTLSAVTGQTGNYSGSFTLPSQGAYTITGSFVPSYVGPSITVMSVTFPWGNASTSPTSIPLRQVTPYQAGGVVFLLIGLGTVVYERRGKLGVT